MRTPIDIVDSASVDLQQLTYFVAVAEERSFTRAAAREHVVQSTVSAAISRLEDDVGVPLLLRAPGGTNTTEAGALLLTRARRLLTDARELRNELRALRGTVEGTVTIGGPLSTGTLDMPAVFQELRRAAPLVDLQVRIVEAAHEWSLAPLQDRRCDLLLMPEPNTVPPGYQTVPVGVLELALITRAEPTDTDRPWTPPQVAAACSIDFPPGWPTRTRTDAYFAAHGVHRKVQIEVADVAAALTLVRAGLGAAFLPASLVQDWADMHPAPLAQALRPQVLVLASRTSPQRPAVQVLNRLILQHRPRVIAVST